MFIFSIHFLTNDDSTLIHTTSFYFPKNSSTLADIQTQRQTDFQTGVLTDIWIDRLSNPFRSCDEIAPDIDAMTVCFLLFRSAGYLTAAHLRQESKQCNVH